MPSQPPDSVGTNSASPLLSEIVDCFLLVAVIGYQPSLPFTHDAVPQRVSARSFNNSFSLHVPFSRE